MTGFLFNDVIFGPVFSRRLGISLGVNLLPFSYKHCTFNCIYCECGWTNKVRTSDADMPGFHYFSSELEHALRQMKEKNKPLNSITFAGNGEPTIHPEFDKIIAKTIELRNQYYPTALVSVLSNATTLSDDKIRQALMCVDRNILKIDAGSEEMFSIINQPLVPITLAQIVENIALFGKQATIQTLFVKGELNGRIVDNTSDKEVELWLGHLKRINPGNVMIYPFARQTPAANLEKIERETLERIANRVKDIGLSVEVFD